MENDENNPYHLYDKRKVAAVLHKQCGGARQRSPQKNLKFVGLRSPPKRLGQPVGIHPDSDEDSRTSSVSSKSQRRRWQRSPQPPVIKAKMETPTNSPRTPNRIRKIRTDAEVYKAAVKIQSAWRGFRTRNLDPNAKAILLEVRLRRMETYILAQQQELTECRKQLAQERIAVSLLTTALSRTSRDVEELKRWKNAMGTGPNEPQLPSPSSLVFEWKTSSTGVLKWDHVEGATSYEIFIDDNKSGCVSGSSTRVLLSDLTENKPYKITVKAGKNSLVESQHSEPLLIECKPIPSEEVNVSIVAEEFVSQNFSADFMSSTLDQFSQVVLKTENK